MSKTKAIILAVFTAWPFLYIVLFFCAISGTILFSGSTHSPVPSTIMMIIFPLHLLTMLEIVILMVIYIIHLFKTEKVSQDKKALWAVVLFLGNMIAMPIYWYLYIWKEQKELTSEPKVESYRTEKTL